MDWIDNAALAWIEAAKQAASEYSRTLRSLLGPRLVRMVLFGSVAKGNARPGSDVDVAVILGRGDREDRNTAFDAAYDISIERGIDLSPLVLSKERLDLYTSLERRLASEIEQDGIEL